MKFGGTSVQDVGSLERAASIVVQQADSRLVPRLTFNEAAELALSGANVLHPDTIAPACERNIPVRILYSSNPDAEGAWITSEGSKAPV